MLFDSKRYTHSGPLELWSGLALVGGKRVAAREFSTGTILHYGGAPGTAQFAFVANAQGYPSDGSPRDINFVAIQFSAHTDVHSAGGVVSSPLQPTASRMIPRVRSIAPPAAA